MSKNRVFSGKSAKGDEPPKRSRVGRPHALEANDEVLRQIRALGHLLATNEETAAVLGVAPSTYQLFLQRCPEAQEAADAGKAEGRLSSKRNLIRMARTNPSCAIFWAKQSDWTDRLETKTTGEISISIDADDMQV